MTTPLVAFVDSDVEVTSADLLRLTRHLADPSVALVWGPARYWYPEDPDLDFDQPTGLDPTRRTFPPGKAPAYP